MLSTWNWFKQVTQKKWKAVCYRRATVCVSFSRDCFISALCTHAVNLVCGSIHGLPPRLWGQSDTLHCEGNSHQCSEWLLLGSAPEKLCRDTSGDSFSVMQARLSLLHARENRNFYLEKCFLLLCLEKNVLQKIWILLKFLSSHLQFTIKTNIYLLRNKKCHPKRLIFYKLNIYFTKYLTFYHFIRWQTIMKCNLSFYNFISSEIRIFCDFIFQNQEVVIL